MIAANDGGRFCILAGIPMRRLHFVVTDCGAREPWYALFPPDGGHQKVRMQGGNFAFVGHCLVDGL